MYLGAKEVSVSEVHRGDSVFVREPGGLFCPYAVVAR